jgi:hypothetical protein
VTAIDRTCEDFLKPPLGIKDRIKETLRLWGAEHGVAVEIVYDGIELTVS